jgi:16S rRNA C1402 N4-methylase RsmH
MYERQKNQMIAIVDELYDFSDDGKRLESTPCLMCPTEGRVHIVTFVSLQDRI